MQNREAGSTTSQDHRRLKLGHKKESFAQRLREIDLKRGDWWSYQLKGFVSVAFGILLLAWEESLLFLVLVMGVQALVKGSIGFVHVILNAKKREKWVLMLLESLIGLFLGVMIISWPEASVKTAAVLIGIWMMATGTAQLATAIIEKTTVKRGLVGAGGLLSVMVGILVVSMPRKTVDLAHKLSAIQSLALGIIFIVLGIYLMLKGGRVEAA
jgi:uncharacterized membrane protein HdeD (DUF308 family)